MPPEQWRGKGLGFCSDIYSFGVMLFEMITGQLPFDGTTEDELARKHLDAPIPRIEERGVQLTSNLTVALNMIIRKAMAKEVKDRYASVE